MLYQVEITFLVHSCFAGTASGDVWMKKDLSIPFPPYKGLSFSLGGWSCTIEDLEEMAPSGHESKSYCQIVWNLEEKRFIVYLPSDKEIYWADLAKRPHRQLSEIVDEYIEQGWEKREEI